MNSIADLEKIARRIRRDILISTTAAGSGHPTSSLSATDLMACLVFGGFFRFEVNAPQHPNNDRLVFSKGHASPLFYALWAAAGKVAEEELLSLRRFGSPLEGHPTMAFPYTEAATGSLGQGLSIGAGMAMNAKFLDRLPYRTFVLLGDSEMAEGSQWEAMELASFYGLDNLIAVMDVNRLGQRGQTMYGHDLVVYEQRAEAFGWGTAVIDGHDPEAICAAYSVALGNKGRPFMIIAKTVKGKGVSFIEDRNGWHGKALKKDELEKALAEIGPVEPRLWEIALPHDIRPEVRPANPPLEISYADGIPVSTRYAYGKALARLGPLFPEMVVLDGEVGNSTYAELFRDAWPDRFFEMYVAEQNMVGVALGLARQGRLPFVSTFAAFFSRAFDQIRMSRYSEGNVKFCGSHAGVSIGEDGSSQMGLEDIALFRTILDSVVFYPSDAVSTEKVVEEAAQHKGIVYIRTTRKDLPLLYEASQSFPPRGSKVLRQSHDDVVTVAGAGITVHEALAAYEELKQTGIEVRVIDLYSIKPLDVPTLIKAAKETKAIITVEDHYAEGGIGEAVSSALAGQGASVHCLAVRKMPKSGKPDELLEYEEISKNAIIRKVKELL